jgi:glucan biosynthesis protein C
MRRYDIDWIRVIAIGLLIIYHSAIAFQPWGAMLGFTTSKEPWLALWWPMSLVNVWRIPLLFFVSGMGVYFAMQSRTPKELLTERTRRILVPYLFGMFAIVPIQLMIWRMHWTYVYNPGHLWFLGNIFVYVLIFVMPFYWMKKKSIAINTPWLMLLLLAVLILEVLLIKPVPYELYAMTWHGFFLGMILFFFGYLLSTKEYWRFTWIALTVAVVLAGLRLSGMSYTWLIPIESVSWIIFVLGMGYKYLNKESKALRYLSQAAYPVYILHIVFQNLFSAVLFSIDMPVQVKFVLLVVLTLSGCLATYEIIKRTNVTRFLFGLKPLPR